MRHVSLLVVAIGGVLSVVPAWAGAILTQDSRSLEVHARVVEKENFAEIGPESDIAPFAAPLQIIRHIGPLISLPTGIVQAEATAAQSSSFNAGPVFTHVRGAGAGNARVSTHRGPDFFAAADAFSDIHIQFSVTTPQTWFINATIFDPRYGSLVSVSLREVAAADYLFDLRGSGTLSNTAGGVLAPGEYELIAQAQASALLLPHFWVFHSKALFEFEFTVVPEPASGLLLLVCVGFAARRSRRRDGSLMLRTRRAVRPPVRAGWG